MHIIEQFLQSKSGKPNGGEDRIVVTPHFAAVIDGATAKDPFDFGGATGGAKVADTLCEAVCALPATADIRTASAAFTALVRQNVFETFNCHPAPGSDRPNASIVMYSAARNEIWRIGDSHYAINDEVHYGSKLIDTQNAAIRAAVNNAFLANGGTMAELLEKDHGRNAIEATLRSQSFFMNNPAAGDYAYAVICGLPVPEHMLHSQPVAPGSIVTLASDGYLELRPTLAQSEAHLSAYYKNDPFMIGAHAATKGIAKGNVAHDDRAWLKFSI